jgi:RimJ/RimL family protein N-acetyltransferase
VLATSTIRTARLALTPLVASDADAMLELYTDERMFEFTGGQPPSLEQLRARYEALERGRSPSGGEQWMNWIVRLGDEQLPVGVMQATVTQGGCAADVAWEVGVAWQGRGIASEAATAMVDWLAAQGVTQLQAMVHPEHAASAAVAARAGLSPTAERIDGEVVWRRNEIA